MAYAQTSYSQKLGNGPYTLAEAGCFVTAFCNLLARFGEPVDPPTLNQHFINHGTYVHDPSEPAGLNDDLAWGSVAAYDGQIGTTQIGGAGWPNSNDAIVKFIYKSTRTGSIVTHFCLVTDTSAHTIIDSWDGVTKVSPYGTPVAWATYERHAVQAVTPPAPAEAPAFTIEAIGEVTKELKIDTKLWDLNQRSWPALVNNPVGSAGAGTMFNTSAIAHHIAGGAYYLPEGSTTQGYNLVDTEDPSPVAAPEPAPTPAPAPAAIDPLQGVIFTPLVPDMKKMFIIKKSGAEKWNFKDVKTWDGFKSVAHYNYGDVVYISGSALHPIGARYEITSNDWNGFDTNGQPNNWSGFNKVDLSENRPADVPNPSPAPVTPAPTPAPAAEPIAVTSLSPAPTPAPTPVLTTTASATAPADWQTTYRPFTKSQKYKATRRLKVSDLAGHGPDQFLAAYNPAPTPPLGLVSVFGTVRKEGIEYYRLRTNNDANFSYWYCVPVTDEATNTPNLVPLKADAISSIEKLLHAILPMWFK